MNLYNHVNEYRYPVDLLRGDMPAYTAEIDAGGYIAPTGSGDMVSDGSVFDPGIGGDILEPPKRTPAVRDYAPWPGSNADPYIKDYKVITAPPVSASVPKLEYEDDGMKIAGLDFKDPKTIAIAAALAGIALYMFL